MAASEVRCTVISCNARRIFKDIAKEVRLFKPGAEVAPGIVSDPRLRPHAWPHRLCHPFRQPVDAGDERRRAQSVPVRRAIPTGSRSSTWTAPLAVKTRRAMLDRAAADRMLVEAYHFPFPASGHIARVGAGYEFVPAMWAPL